MLTLVHHLRLSVYEDGELVYDGDSNSPAALLKALGYDVTIEHVRWEDMPHDNKPSWQVRVPSALADLRKHLDDIERKKRREEIHYLHYRLQQLEEQEQREASIASHADTPPAVG